MTWECGSWNNEIHTRMLVCRTVIHKLLLCCQGELAHFQWMHAKHWLELVVVNCRENGPGQTDIAWLSSKFVPTSIWKELMACNHQSRVLSASLFWFYQVLRNTDTHRNIEVSWMEGRGVLCLNFPTWLRRKFWNVATVIESKSPHRTIWQPWGGKPHCSFPTCPHLNNRIVRVGDIFRFLEIALLWRLRAAYSSSGGSTVAESAACHQPPPSTSTCATLPSKLILLRIATNTNEQHLIFLQHS